MMATSFRQWVDMVCEKEPEHEHDFSTDSIQLDLQDDWLTAKGTTLGADNGLGVAAGPREQRFIRRRVAARFE